MGRNLFLRRRNPDHPAGLSVKIAAFVAAFFLALLSVTLYNVWHYDVVRCQTVNGNYHARLTGEIDGRTLEMIRAYAGVESAVISEAEAEGEKRTVDILFSHPSAVYREMPQLAEAAGLSRQDIIYHKELLNYYFAVDPDDPDTRDARGLLLIFGAAGVLSCASLILIIRHAYAVSMSDKIRQLGILASVGATPAQLRGALVREAFLLSAVPVGAGILLGTAGSAGLVAWINAIGNSVAENRIKVPFACPPVILGLPLLGTFFTVLISAWMPAWRLSRLTPLEAIRGAGEAECKKKQKYRLLRFFFGLEGELAGKALRTRRKALRTASLSLTAGFLAFGFIQCLFTVMQLSTDLTYFGRFQNAWDVMATVKETGISQFVETEPLQKLPDVRDVLVYQKGSARRLLTEEELSEEFKASGGFEGAPERYVTKTAEGWLVHAPLYVIDDASFLRYCRHTGIRPSLDGAVIFNQVRDGTDPNFRVRHFLPYLKEAESTALWNEEGETPGIPVLGFARELPVMREEYQTQDYYELIHVLPASLWARIGGESWEMETDTYIRILAGDSREDAYTEISGSARPDRERLDRLEAEVSRAIAGCGETETENRIGAKEASDAANGAIRAFLGGFCLLLAVIGVGNVFSNALGFAWQRRRETARYLSLGMTPGEIGKMFFVEVLLLSFGPVLFSLPVLAGAVWLFMRTAYLDIVLLLPRLPAVTVSLLAFALTVFLLVALAYYLGSRKLLKMDLAETLRDEMCG